MLNCRGRTVVTGSKLNGNCELDKTERLNTLTHLAGLMLAAVGAMVLLLKANASGDVLKIVAAAGFSLSILLLYAASSMFHSSSGAHKAKWEVVDHCAIYVLIAGTYLPFGLVMLSGPWRWALLAVVVALALAGIGNEILRTRGTSPPLWLYIANGWIGVAALAPAAAQLEAGGLAGLLTGAGLYTAGVLFYRIGSRFKHAHGIWHLFVLGGTTSHYFTVLIWVI